MYNPTAQELGMIVKKNQVKYLMMLTEKCQAANINPSAMGDRISFDVNGIYHHIQDGDEVNKPEQYVIDSLSVNNLLIMEDHSVVAQRMGDIARNNRKFDANKIGATIRTAFIARKKGELEVKVYGIIQDDCFSPDYSIMFSQVVDKLFDYWYLQPILSK